ncbi:MAG: hypothetical protein RI947_484 [Candidatus Parcubacteria bacterium]|jgi:hypothetical protein
MELIVLLIILVLFYRHFRQREYPSLDERSNTLKTVIDELSDAAKHHPYRTLSEQLQAYKQELAHLKGPEVVSSEKSTSVKQPPAYTRNVDISDILANWYSENSINMLLYIGAFLIVASAALFVGFQWEDIEGSIKVFILMLITLGFLVSGVLFYRQPKIMNAGIVFSGIGSLLVPLCGFAYYSFYLKNTGATLGMTWLATSVISGILYIFFLKYFKSSFYTYSAGLSTVSFSLAAVQNAGLDKSYYILAGIFSSFILLLIRLYFVKPQKTDVILRPLEICSNIVMGASLFFGFILGASEDLLFQMEGTVSVFIASLYYIVSYYSLGIAWQLALSLILLPVSVFFFTQWQDIPAGPLHYILMMVGLSYIPLVLYFRQLKRSMENNVVQIIITVLFIIVTITGMFSDITGTQRIILLILAASGFGALTVVSKHYGYIFLASLNTAVAMIVASDDIFHLSAKPYILTQYLLIVGIAIFVVGIRVREQLSLRRSLFSSSALFLVFAYFGALRYDNYLAEVALVITAVLLVSAYYLKLPKIAYFSNAALYFTVYFFIEYLKIDSLLYPFIFCTLSAGLYAVSHIIPDEYVTIYKNSGFAGLLATPILYGIYARDSYYRRDHKELELNALLTAYVATGIYAYEAVKRSTASLGYFASAVGMITVLWHISYSGVTEVQYYTGPLGVYFMSLAYTRKMRNDEDNRRWLDFCALFFIIVPAMFQSFGSEGLNYSLLLGGYGLLLVLAGITINYLRYTYGGIFAIVISVFAQTYGIIFNIPRWLLIGLIGLVFLVSAVYLLQNRKEK